MSPTPNARPGITALPTTGKRAPGNVDVSPARASPNSRPSKANVGVGQKRQACIFKSPRDPKQARYILNADMRTLNNRCIYHSGAARPLVGRVERRAVLRCDALCRAPRCAVDDARRGLAATGPPFRASPRAPCSERRARSLKRRGIDLVPLRGQARVKYAEQLAPLRLPPSRTRSQESRSTPAPA